MEESATLKMAQLARELRQEGHDVIALSLGEPDFDTPDIVKNAAKAALDDGYTKYTPVPGIPELREAISKKFKNDNDLDYSSAQIVVSNGAKQSIANVCQALLDEGDEVIVFTPYWVSYIAIVKLAGGVPVCLSAGVEDDFIISADQLEKAITPRTKMVLFSTPCNPTGSVFNREKLLSYANVLRKNPNIVVVSDEIYEHIIFDGERHTSIGSLEGMIDRTVTVNGFSKSFSMTGWRLGYIGAPLAIAKACTKIQGQFTSGANAFSQKAAVTALEQAYGEAAEMRDAFNQRRDLVLRLLNDIPGLKTNQPKGAFYVFPDVSSYFGLQSPDGKIEDAEDLCSYILKDAHVAVVSGDAFGAPDCFRISYAASEEQLRTAISRIQSSLIKLK